MRLSKFRVDFWQLLTVCLVISFFCGRVHSHAWLGILDEGAHFVLTSAGVYYLSGKRDNDVSVPP